MQPYLPTMTAIIIEAVRNEPATCDELEVRLDMKHQSVSAILRQQKILGVLRENGDNRPTRSGRLAAVHEYVPEGER